MLLKIETSVERDGIRYGIHGECDQRYLAVVEAFKQNFTDDEDLGAATAAYNGESLIVDLWGGFADYGRTRPWQRNTIVNMMSVGKGLVAFAIHMLASRDQIDLDAPVATYWPEFAQNGKANVLISHVLDHRAGLPALSEPLTRRSIFDWNEMTGALARQAPMSTPGTTAAYHIRTMGFILGEIISRVSGMPFAEFVQQEISGPLNIDFFFGVPLAEFYRIAEFIPSRTNTVLDLGAHSPDSLMAMATAQQPLDLDYNSDEWRLSVIPSSNGHGNARAVATLYAVLANGGTWRGRTFIKGDALVRARTEVHHLVEQALGRQYHQALGFILNSPPIVYLGPRSEAFGVHGAGGSLGMADPENTISFSYATAKMHSRMDNGPRARRLIDAVFSV